MILVARGAGEHETIAGLEAGADDFLAKPFSGRELLVRVRTRLELTAMRRRNTQQEEMLVNLRRTLHARDEFFSAASHELRTPLTTLGLQTEGLLQAYGPGKELARSEDDCLRRRLGLIRKQVVRLDQLVDQLLDISRLIEGRLDLHIEEVDLQSVALEAIDLLREPAQRAGSPILFRGDDSVVGRWDRLRLGQVVTNLLSNAIKFGRGRPIEIELVADEREAELQVRDDGEGIEPEAQARIFERFERATSVRRHPGMGLGLLDHKTDRRRLSRHDIRGERNRPRVRVHGQVTEGRMNDPPRLLIVDDDPELRQSAVDALSDAGYETSVAGNGWEALAATQGPRVPQLILLDLMMPDMNGWQFREAQRRDARIKDIPLVVITASRDSGQPPDRRRRRPAQTVRAERPARGRCSSWSGTPSAARASFETIWDRGAAVPRSGLHNLYASAGPPGGGCRLGGPHETEPWHWLRSRSSHAVRSRQLTGRSRITRGCTTRPEPRVEPSWKTANRRCRQRTRDER